MKKILEGLVHAGEQKRFGCVWFTYSRDEEIVRLSLAAARLTLGDEALLVVADDGFSPCSEGFEQVCREIGAVYLQTLWSRDRNLLGPEHLKGATRLMAEIAEHCEVVVKIDSDAVLMGCDWLERLEASTVATMSGSYKGLHNYPMGNCYAVRAEVCAALAEDCETYPAWAHSFEDYEVGVRLHRLSGGNARYSIRYVCAPADGFWLCNPGEVDVEGALENARVVSCGFGYHGTPPIQRGAYKKAQVEVMEKLLEGMRSRGTVGNCEALEDSRLENESAG